MLAAAKDLHHRFMKVALSDLHPRTAEAWVELVVDIRAAPVRARRASPKNQLAAISTRPIAYRHLRGLGTPKRGRDAARGGDIESFERIFREHMEEPEALLDLGEAIALAKTQPVCLLCLERDPSIATA